MRMRYNGRHWCYRCNDLTDHARYIGEMGKGTCQRCGKNAAEEEE